jgi:hypothetical protein
MKNMIIFFCGAMLLFGSCAGPQVKRISVIKIQKQEAKLKKEAEIILKKENKKQPRYYTALEDDTMWSIARKNYPSPLCWMAIAEANNIKPPYYVHKDQKFLLPDIDAKTFKDPVCPRPKNTKKQFEYRTVENKCFGVGEKLVYDVKYFNVTAGIGILEIKEMAEINGRQAYHIVATARTAPFFETFYRVDDTIESYMDVLGLFSLKYSKKLEEGTYKAFSEIEFFPEQQLAIKYTKEQYKVPSFVQDVLSELYYFRNIDMTGKDEVYIDVCADEGKPYQVLVKKIGKERVTVDAGTFDCTIIRPYLKFEGIFRQKGEVDIWITDDANKVPVLLKSHIAIGSVDAVLQSATIVEAE